GLGGVGPDLGLALLAVPAGYVTRSADVDDVVVVLNALVGCDWERVDAQPALRRLLLGSERQDSKQGGSSDEADAPGRHGRCTPEIRDQHGTLPRDEDRARIRQAFGRQAWEGGSARVTEVFG